MSLLSDCGQERRAEVRFDSTEVVARGKSTWEVLRGWLVFRIFTFDTLVDNSLKVSVNIPVGKSKWEFNKNWNGWARSGSIIGW